MTGFGCSRKSSSSLGPTLGVVPVGGATPNGVITSLLPFSRQLCYPTHSAHPPIVVVPFFTTTKIVLTHTIGCIRSQFRSYLALNKLLHRLQDSFFRGSREVRV